MVRASFRVVSEELVPPHSVAAGGRVELAGADIIYDHFNVKAAFFFPSVLPVPALREALARALDSFPILAGRPREEGGRHYVALDNSGAAFRHQLAYVTGTDGLRHGETGPLMPRFCAGAFKAVPNDPSSPLLTVTLTEVLYQEPWICAPRFGCSCAAEDPEPAPWGTQASSPIIRFAVAFSFSHTVVDGCGIAHFLAAWAAASQGSSFPAAAATRGVLMETAHHPEDGEAPFKYKLVSSLGHTRVLTSFMLNQVFCEPVVLRFSQEEVEAIKAAAMAPLEGSKQWVSTSNALAAHIWPIVSELLLGADTSMVPLIVIVNSRKQLGIPMNYAGNVVSIQHTPRATPGDSLTALALKVRAACAPRPEEVKEDHSFMQKMAEQGKAKYTLYRGMRDAVLSRPRMIWDDISGFSAGGKEQLSLCGVSPIAADLILFNVPGMIMVVAPPDGTAGKELRVHLTKSQARKLRSAPYMQRVHAFRKATPAAGAVHEPASAEESKQAVEGPAGGHE